MAYNGHLIAWTVAIAVLVGGLLLRAFARRRKKPWLATYGAAAFVLTVVIAFSGWSVWPDQTRQHFLSVIYDSKFDQVQSLLSERQQLTVSEDGSVTVLADDGTTVTIAPNDLPLAAASVEAEGVPAPSRNLLQGSMDFNIGTLEGKACVIHCTAQRGKVHLRSVIIAER